MVESGSSRAKPNGVQAVAVIAIRQMSRNTGAVRIAQEQILILKRLGYKVVILAEKIDPDICQQEGVIFKRILRWPFKGRYRRIWYNRRVQRWCSLHRPDLIVSHADAETPDIFYMHNCVHLANLRIEGKELGKEDELAAIQDYVLQRKKFRTIVVNSKLMAREVMSRYGVEKDKIEVAYPGYDESRFNIEAAKENRQVTREKIGVDDGQHLIGLVTSGNFKKRNVELFVKMAGLLHKAKPGKYRFLVIGSDNFSSYRKLAEFVGVEAEISWQKPTIQVQDIYGALDVFVLPAHIEEFGCVVLEAMACGTPVMVSSWTGASELFNRKHPDLVLSSYQPEDWAAKIEELLQRGAEKIGKSLANIAVKYSFRLQYENSSKLLVSRNDLED